jgi:hypothetical protein
MENEQRLKDEDLKKQREEAVLADNEKQIQELMDEQKGLGSVQKQSLSQNTHMDDKQPGKKAETSTQGVSITEESEAQ